MSVSLRLGLGGGAFPTVSKTLLAGLALTVAAGLMATGAIAASFEDIDQIESVLLPEADHGELVAAPPASQDTPDDPDDSASTMLIAGCTDLTCTSGADGCLGASGQECSCSECTGEEGLINRIHRHHAGRLVDSDPVGLLQKLGRLHHASGACWTGRADALLLWRNAPSAQALITNNQTGITALDANQIDSALAAGPRFSLFRNDTCGHGWEATYLRAFNFRGQYTLPTIPSGYDVALPGIFGDQEIQLDGASVNLGSGIQSFELNRYHKVSNNIRLLGGFRWVEWRESATLTTAVPTGVTDIYQSNVMNSLYGGQIGFEALVLTTNWLRVDSVMKGGAYGNNVAANSLLVKPDAAINESLGLSQSPASCGFVGELGFTGVMPITNCLDFRFGYFGLWLQGLAQPTRQFLTQDLVNAPPTGKLDTKGGTVVQGVSFGLEGRW